MIHIHYHNLSTVLHKLHLTGRVYSTSTLIRAFSSLKGIKDLSMIHIIPPQHIDTLAGPWPFPPVTGSRIVIRRRHGIRRILLFIGRSIWNRPAP